MNNRERFALSLSGLLSAAILHCLGCSSESPVVKAPSCSCSETFDAATFAQSLDESYACNLAGMVRTSSGLSVPSAREKIASDFFDTSAEKGLEVLRRWHSILCPRIKFYKLYWLSDTHKERAQALVDGLKVEYREAQAARREERALKRTRENAAREAEIQQVLDD